MNIPQLRDFSVIRVQKQESSLALRVTDCARSYADEEVTVSSTETSPRNTAEPFEEGRLAAVRY